jgi:hypothetical protein
MTNIGKLRLLFASSFIPAALCATGCAGGQSIRGSAPPPNCFQNRHLRGFEALDQRNLIVDGPGRTSYHIVLDAPSIGLLSESAIGVFDDGDGRICPYGRDSVIINGALRENISIRSIETIDDSQVEALKVEFGVLEPTGNAVRVEQIL